MIQIIQIILALVSLYIIYLLYRRYRCRENYVTQWITGYNPRVPKIDYGTYLNTKVL